MEYLTKLAIIAIETELLCYPSLGLVSINSCGSHQDMNFNLFTKSKETFSVYFDHIYNLVLSYKSLNFHKLRVLGVEQEKRMFKARASKRPKFRAI
ncbi:triphosphoribosyl-dephospho-CoA synthase [Candidatus Phytoplasma citri]|uniref:triphosphoribosyl-dephospho-CoA synthase n=1 Tax=Candidatus Phytoplasma citri TaxID=180978 RepID=A0ABU8ZRT9_9MOLU